MPNLLFRIRSSQMRRISQQELTCPSAAEKFRDCLANIASPSWDVDLNCHYDKISADIDKAIRSAFPKPKSVAKKPHVGQNMLQHIDYSHDIKRQIRRVKKINVPQTLAYVEAQTAKAGLPGQGQQSASQVHKAPLQDWLY